MTNKVIFSIVALAAILVIVVLSQFGGSRKADFETQIKTPHFTDSTPLHSEVYAVQPINITINFNFDLAAGSKIAVTSQNNTEWAEDTEVIEDNNTALKRKLKQGMPDGDYLVKYTACWVDKSCNDGQFSFKIDSTKKAEYYDLRGKTEVMIKMENLKFTPNKIIISKGTKVTWENFDQVSHFVNTETHPEHTYYPVQNSQELPKTGTYAAKFEVLGQYNYHCSAHVPQGMLGSLIVEN